MYGYIICYYYSGYTHIPADEIIASLHTFTFFTFFGFRTANCAYKAISRPYIF